MREHKPRSPGAIAADVERIAANGPEFVRAYQELYDFAYSGGGGGGSTPGRDQLEYSNTVPDIALSKSWPREVLAAMDKLIAKIEDDIRMGPIRADRAYGKPKVVDGEVVHEYKPVEVYKKAQDTEDNVVFASDLKEAEEARERRTARGEV